MRLKLKKSCIEEKCGGKNKEKVKEKKKWRKINNRLKVDKLFLYAIVTSFNYIWFSFIFFKNITKHMEIISFFNIFREQT